MQVSKSKPAGEKVAKVPKPKKVPLQSSSGFNIDANVVEEKVVQTTKREPHADKSIEETYQKKTQLEHILLRPDTYVGSIEKHTQTLWVYEDEKMVNRSISFVPGLYKIFDEILVNAADNKQRDPKMDTVKVSCARLLIFNLTFSLCQVGGHSWQLYFVLSGEVSLVEGFHLLVGKPETHHI